MGTPFCDAKTLADLDWLGIREAVAERATTDRGRTLALALEFTTDAEGLRGMLAEVEEARALIAADGPPPFGGVIDLGETLTRAAHGQVIEARELLAVASTLAATHAVRDYLALGKAAAPRLWANGQVLTPMPRLAERLSQSFDSDGNVADTASPDLARARAEARRERGRAKARLEEIVQSPEYSPYLQDTFFTVRDDRFVVPLKAHAKARFGGVVHNASQTGETFFVEPAEIVEVNNRLRIAEAEVQHETYRVLLELSRAVTEVADTLERDAALLASLDATFAKAALADALGARVPQISDDGSLLLVAARHPLLALRLAGEGRAVVSNTIRVEAGGALLVSGLNAGGKTVALLTAGACALMTHAGIPVPCGGGTRIPVLRTVRSDIADDQNIHCDLSTFSGQIERMKAILDDAGPGALVLLDELAVGTDPAQGAALAQACLEALTARGARVIATTHYDRLKTLSADDARFVNAAVGVDAVSREPTYVLTIGIPGASGAFETARRLGLYEAIVARAVELTGPGGQSLDRLLGELQGKASALDRERDALAAEKADAERLRVATEAARVEADRARGQAARVAREEVLAEVREAREELAARVRELQRGNAPAVRDAAPRDVARRVADAKARAEALEKKLNAATGVVAKRVFEVGDQVHVVALSRDGVVESVDAGRARAVVRLGGLKTTVSLGDIEPARRERPTDSPPSRRPAEGGHAEGGGDRARRVDLRGLRVDEALAALDRALDAAYGAGETAIVVVHGYGTGALKNAVREAAEHSPVAGRIRAGDEAEGGDAATVIELRQ